MLINRSAIKSLVFYDKKKFVALIYKKNVFKWTEAEISEVMEKLNEVTSKNIAIKSN